MTSAEHIQYLKRFKKLSTQILKSKRASTKFLVDAGIYNSKGKLKAAYSIPKTKANK